MSPPIRCSFTLREPVPGGYRYEPVHMSGRDGSGQLHTHVPPVVGDLLYLVEVGSCVVVLRDWTFSSWGSMDWPYNRPEPSVGPMLQLIVERSEGPIRNEVYSPGEDD